MLPGARGIQDAETDWHLADTVQAMANGSLDAAVQTSVKAMGVDASMIMDFHGDGTRTISPTCVSTNWTLYFRALGAVGCRFPVDSERGSQRAPGRTLDARVSEAGAPVDRPAARTVPWSRTIRYARSSAWPMQRRSWTSCAAKADTCIKRIEDERLDRFSGPIWRAITSRCQLPGRRQEGAAVRPSSPRLGDRAFDLIDELNNQGLRKRLLGEVDVFQFEITRTSSMPT